MKLLLGVLFILVCNIVSAQVGTPKKVKMSTYQTILEQCLDKKIDVSKISTNKELYKAINSFYALVSSEVVYREVVYQLKDDVKKLRLEAGQISLYSIDEDENATLLSTEKIGATAQGNELRHKALSAESRMNQLLFRATINSDYSKVRESRSKQVSLNMESTDGQIKGMDIVFGTSKKSLNCQQVESKDICICR